MPNNFAVKGEKSKGVFFLIMDLEAPQKIP
jgi:hypothetical protein